jgi:hypothetical protein
MIQQKNTRYGDPSGPNKESQTNSPKIHERSKTLSLPDTRGWTAVVFLFALTLLSTLVMNGQENIFPAETPTPSGGSQASSGAARPVFRAFALAVDATQEVLLNPDPLAPFCFDSLNYDEQGALSSFPIIPPDPIGAAGSNHLLSVVNSAVECHTKTGVKQFSRSLQDFFTSLRPVNLPFDPKVLFDQYNGRFLVVALERQDTARGDSINGSRILLAVSQTSDPTGAWYFFAINSKLNVGGSDKWADYPGFAVDSQAVYVTANMFGFGGGAYAGVRLWIVNKTQLYTGGVASFSVFDPYTDCGSTGSATTTQPALMCGAIPGGLGTFLVSYGGLTSSDQSFVQIVTVQNPLAVCPTFSQQFIPVGSIEGLQRPLPDLPKSPQHGSSVFIDSGDRRPINAVWRNNALWFAATIRPASGPDAGQATAHWWKLDTSQPTQIALVDQGDVGGEEIAPDTYTFYPAITVDSSGNMAIGFGASGSAIYPSAAFTFRLATDSPGSVRPAIILAEGLDYYARTFSAIGYGMGPNRWGDFSGISLDPVDELSLWVFNQYALTRGSPSAFGEDGRWGTRWGRFQAIPSSLCHPADNSPRDNRITLGEMTSYVSAWRMDASWPIPPDPPSLDFAVRAAYLWRRGEVYLLNCGIQTAPLWWVNGMAQALSNSTLVEPTGTTPAVPFAPAVLGEGTSFIRNLPDLSTPDVPLTVTITANLDSSGCVWAVEDSPPFGWTVLSISDGGSFDPVNLKVKWGFFNGPACGGSTHVVLSYSAVPPSNEAGTINFAGQWGLDRSLGPITGDTEIHSDADGDGVADIADLCPETPHGNVVSADGCSIDQIVPCSGPSSGGTWKTHGEYVSAVGRITTEFLKHGLITRDQRNLILAQAVRSSCGQRR